MKNFSNNRYSDRNERGSFGHKNDGRKPYSKDGYKKDVYKKDFSGYKKGGYNKENGFNKDGEFKKNFSDKRKFENEDFHSEDRFSKRENEELPENVLEGRNPIREALKAGRTIERLLVAQGEIQGSVKEIVYDAKANGAIIQEVERTRLDHISVTGTHQGVIAYVAVKEYCTVDDILDYAKEKNEQPFVIVLDGICDPQNLGAIIRTAECAGAHGVIIPQRRAVGLTPVVAKCSAGAIEYMRIARVTNISQTIEKLKKAGVWVYGASMEGKTYSRVNMTGPVALVIGAEGEGISPLVKKNCDCLVSMPQVGHIDSLNASVAAGVLVYDIVRQRGEKN